MTTAAMFFWESVFGVLNSRLHKTTFGQEKTVRIRTLFLWQKRREVNKLPLLLPEIRENELFLLSRSCNYSLEGTAPSLFGIIAGGR